MPGMTDTAPTPTLDLARFLPYRLSVLSNTISQTVARLYEARFGITIPEWRVIAVLGSGCTMSAGEVAAATAMERVQVSRAISRMLDSGLLIRETGERDRRRADLTLTARGRAIYTEIAPLALAYETRIVSVLDPAEAAMLDRLLAKLQGQANALASSPPPAPQGEG